MSLQKISEGFGEGLIAIGKNDLLNQLLVQHIDQIKQLLSDERIALSGKEIGDTANLDWLAGELTQEFSSAEDYQNWFSVAMNGEDLAYPDFIPGMGILGGGNGDENTWINMFQYVFSLLPSEHKLFLQDGLKFYINSQDIKPSTEQVQILTRLYIAIMLLGSSQLTNKKV